MIVKIIFACIYIISSSCFKKLLIENYRGSEEFLLKNNVRLSQLYLERIFLQFVISLILISQQIYKT